MKTTVPFKQSLVKFMLFLTALVSCVLTQAQSGSGGCSGSGPCNQGLVFSNSNYVSNTGTGAGTVNAVYRFPNVGNDMDALVKINDRSSSLVTLTSIDLTNTGWGKAFQPRIAYNDGNVSGSKNWWMEFEISFVDRNDNNPVTLTTFDVTALDLDGDDDDLRESTSFYNPTNYTLEANTQLTVSNLLQLVLGLLSPVGKTFEGITDDLNGIDTTNTQIMTTLRYTNKSSVKFRLGGSTNSSSNNANRMYSVWFKNFTYNDPVTLPVKLASFTATLNNNNKADLKWTTVSEVNLNHFVIEKSLDGITYSDAGVVFAYGNTTDKTSYSFSDDLSATTAKVIYYRLRSVDVDSKSQYSETRIIRLSKQSEAMITILTYPNPVTNELRITLPTNWQNKKVLYEVFTINGTTARKSESASAGQTETLNVSNLAKGFYMIRVSCEGQTAQQKIVIQ